MSDVERLKKLGNGKSVQLSEAGNIYLGADPEFFFKNKKTGEVVGSEMVLPVLLDKFREIDKERGSNIRNTPYRVDYGELVTDGLQAEIHISADTCRERVRNKIVDVVAKTRDMLISHMPDIAISTDYVVDVDDSTFESLPATSRELGCNPSQNIYNPTAKVGIDIFKYKYRHAGGHMHFGISKYTMERQGAVSNIVKLMDLLVGNTLVLLDRADYASERRKYYGRAGEFRIKPYGLEYRTPSPIWLRSNQLLSLAFGLGRQAIRIEQNGLAKFFLGLVREKDVIDAINNNDFSLAKANFDKIKDALVLVSGDRDRIVELNYMYYDKEQIDKINKTGYVLGGQYPLNAETMPYFEHYIRMGVEYWHGNRIMGEEVNDVLHKVDLRKDVAAYDDGHLFNARHTGISDYLKYVVRADLRNGYTMFDSVKKYNNVHDISSGIPSNIKAGVRNAVSRLVTSTGKKKQVRSRTTRSTR